MIAYYAIMFTYLLVINLIALQYFSRETYSYPFLNEDIDDYLIYLITSGNMFYATDWSSVMNRVSMTQGKYWSLYFITQALVAKFFIDNLFFSYFIYIYSDLYKQYINESSNNITFKKEMSLVEKKEALMRTQFKGFSRKRFEMSSVVPSRETMERKNSLLIASTQIKKRRGGKNFTKVSKFGSQVEKAGKLRGEQHREKKNRRRVSLSKDDLSMSFESRDPELPHIEEHSVSVEQEYESRPASAASFTPRNSPNDRPEKIVMPKVSAQPELYKKAGKRKILIGLEGPGRDDDNAFTQNRNFRFPGNSLKGDDNVGLGEILESSSPVATLRAKIPAPIVIKPVEEQEVQASPARAFIPLEALEREESLMSHRITAIDRQSIPPSSPTHSGLFSFGRLKKRTSKQYSTLNLQDPSFSTSVQHLRNNSNQSTLAQNQVSPVMHSPTLSASSGMLRGSLNKLKILKNTSNMSSYSRRQILGTNFFIRFFISKYYNTISTGFSLLAAINITFSMKPLVCNKSWEGWYPFLITTWLSNLYFTIEILFLVEVS